MNRKYVYYVSQWSSQVVLLKPREFTHRLISKYSYEPTQHVLLYLRYTNVDIQIYTCHLGHPRLYVVHPNRTNYRVESRALR